MSNLSTPISASPATNGANKGTQSAASAVNASAGTALNAQTNGVFGALFSQFLSLQDGSTPLIGNNTSANLNNENIAQSLNLPKNLTDPNQLMAFLQNISQNVSAEAQTTLQAQKTNNSQSDTALGSILMIDGTDLGTEEGLLARISAQINALQKDSESTGILFNLTPEQMTQLQKDIAQAIETGDLPEPPAGFEFIVVALNDPQAQKQAQGTNNALFQTLSLAQNESATNNSGAQNSAMTPILNTDQNTASDLLNNPLQNGLDVDGLLNIQSSTEKFSALLKNAAQMRLNAAGDNATQNSAAPAPTNASTDNAAQIALTANGALSGQAFSDGDLISSFSWDDMSLFTAGSTTSGLSSSAAPLLNSSAASLTNISTQAGHASLSHPSTSMVAATLSKAAGAPENKAITLQLDPPELGRIEVRMTFGKDKTLKTHIIAEKPEAHIMLQRDAQTLEKALQDSGLDAGGSSLEFSLAQDGHNFENNGRHDGSRNHASYGGNQGDDDIDMMQIETTMNWAIDPETGHTHYSILV